MGRHLLKLKIGRAIRNVGYYMRHLRVTGTGILTLVAVFALIICVVMYGTMVFPFTKQILSRAWLWGTNVFENTLATFCGLSIGLEDSKLILQKGYPILWILEKDIEDTIQSKSLGDMLKAVVSTLTGVDLSIPRTLLRSEVRYLSSVRDMPFTVSRSYSRVERARSSETSTSPVLSSQGLRPELDELQDQVGGLQQVNTIRRIRELAEPSENRNANTLSTARVADIPTVGVYYTHTSESFVSMSGVTHTQGTCGDIVMIGRELIRRLEDRYGVRVAYSEIIHDYPNWSRAYTNALQTAVALVKDNPSLKMLLDIHRDGFDDELVTPKEAKNIVTANINGVSVARILFVVTTDDFGLAHPNWRSNYSFAVKLNSKLNEMYPGLSRGIDVRKDARFNQHVHERALIVEVGAYISEEEELRRSVAMLADVIAAISREI